MYLTPSRNGGCTLTSSVRAQLFDERLSRGMSTSDMGRALGIQAVHFERLERGVSTPKFALLEAWAAALGFGVELALTDSK